MRTKILRSNQAPLFRLDWFFCVLALTGFGVCNKLISSSSSHCLQLFRVRISSHLKNLYKTLSVPLFVSLMASPAPDSQNVSTPSLPHGRPLQREGARHFLSAAEQAMQDTMLRSSPPPESALGKRVRQDDSLGDNDGDTEPDEDSETPQPQCSPPSISNITAATLRYASKKKLRPEQRDEVEAFLLVSTS